MIFPQSSSFSRNHILPRFRDKKCKQ